MARVKPTEFLEDDLLQSPSSNTTATLVDDSDSPSTQHAGNYCQHLEKQIRSGVDTTYSDVAPMFHQLETAFSPRLETEESFTLSAWEHAIQVAATWHVAREDTHAWGTMDHDPARPNLWTLSGTFQRREGNRSSRKYRGRIEELSEEALLDGIILSGASERDFWSFIRSVPSAPQAGIVLLDSGTLRAVWKDGVIALVGLQFLGSGWIEYVILKRRVGSTRVAQTSGVDTVEGVRRQLRAFDLTCWLNV
ncbi:MAG: hypothetical protein OXC31_24335 [Spirochaetaceae bacterium]|nr:hypothetical protein [Spirochaetaceae bacterium]